MKTLNLSGFVLMIFLPFSAIAQNAWTRVSPLPQENTINDITKIPGTNKLMAVGEGSMVMTSDDGGETWDIMLHPAGMNNSYLCKGIHFVNETTGFINGGKETILKTTDAGLTWTLKYQGNTIYEWRGINDIWFVDETNGFAVGDNGQLLTTTDTGENWLPVESGTGSQLSKIVFVNNLTGFIFSSGINCLKTTDGGQSWSWEPLMPEVPQVNFYDCHFVNETTGFVYLQKYGTSDGGFIYKTTDSGFTWNLVYENNSIYSCKFVFYDEQIGMASCGTYNYQNKILRTNDGGNTWTEVLSTYILWSSNYAMIYVDQNTAFTMGMNGMIYKTTDGGLTWSTEKISLFSGTIFKAQFFGEQTGYALTDISSGGIACTGLMKTQDGGNNWTLIYSNCYTEDVSFYFLDAETGFIIDDNNLLMKTEDGGATWTERSLSYDLYPIDIEFFGTNHGIIVGMFNVIKTANGGITWEEFAPAGGSAYFAAVEYRSNEEIYIIGGGGDLNSVFFKSIDGGSTWQSFPIEGVNFAQAIALPDENTIVIAADNSIYKSNDDGETWTQSTSSNPDYIYFQSIVFPSSQVGYAVGHGEFATIEKTADGGNTWFPLETNTTSRLNTACFFDDYNGLVFGELGVVLKTTSGGIVGIENTLNDSVSRVFTVVPNPIEGDINIRVKESNIEFPLQVTLTDITGRELLNQQISGAVNQFSLPANNLKPGIYLCQIIARDGRTETIKLVRR